MIIDIGTTTVSTAGTEQQISNTNNRVLWIKAKALAANSGIAYLGVSDVTSTNGYELSAGNEIEINFKDVGGSVVFSSIYVDVATNGDKVCWAVILDG
jgi:predicted amino acid racemase|tara:strand:- start:3243 stop:3536 length:294 start_codon:yes stop_codon:yes gene_type:complete